MYSYPFHHDIFFMAPPWGHCYYPSPIRHYHTSLRNPNPNPDPNLKPHPNPNPTLPNYPDVMGEDGE